MAKHLVLASEPFKRKVVMIQGILTGPPDSEIALESFGAVHNLFVPKNAEVNERKNLWGVLRQALTTRDSNPTTLLRRRSLHKVGGLVHGNPDKNGRLRRSPGAETQIRKGGVNVVIPHGLRLLEHRRSPGNPPMVRKIVGNH